VRARQDGDAGAPFVFDRGVKMVLHSTASNDDNFTVKC